MANVRVGRSPERSEPPLDQLFLRGASRHRTLIAKRINIADYCKNSAAGYEVMNYYLQIIANYYIHFRLLFIHIYY